MEILVIGGTRFKLKILFDIAFYQNELYDILNTCKRLQKDILFHRKH